MAEKQKLEIDVVLNAEDSVQKLRDLKKLQREVTAGSADYAKIQRALKDTADSIEEAKVGATGLKDALEEAPGPVGNLFKGLRQVEIATKSWGAALKATGIGLLVATIGLLVGAFAKTEGAMKALEPLFIQFEKLLGGLVNAFQPLIIGFAKLAEKILPVLIKGIAAYYGGLVSLFTLIKEAGSGVGNILEGIFTFDPKKREEGLNQLKGSLDKATERYNQFQKDFEAGQAKETETEKKNREEREKLAKEAADKKAERDRKAKEAAEKAFQDKLKLMEANDKLDEAQLKKLKEEALILAQNEQEKLDVEKKFAELAHQARLKDLNDKMALYKKDSLEYKNLQTEKVNAEADYIGQVRGFADQQTKITEDKNKKIAEDEKKSAEEKRGIRLTDLQTLFEDLDRENQKIDGDFAADLERLQQQKLILQQQEATELSNTELNEFQKAEVRKKYADARKKISDEEVANEKAASEAKTELQLAYANAVGSFGQLLQQAAGENKGLAIAGIVIEQAAAIASIAVNASKNFVKDGGVTSPLAWANLAAAGVQAASAVIAAKKGIDAINKTTIPGGSGASGGGGASVAPPTYSAPRGMSAPVVTAGATSQSPSSQIAETLAMSSGKPVKAYVVSQDIQSQTALDRRTNTAATFGGG